jgi:hypothetical protein
MATTTTNFGWDIPQSTDLVKDGATAIAALGQDIDTAMVDLKGGTTGQVLAKASGADLDFSWVAQDDSNAIQNAIVDAKGDLISATANDTPARLAVGTNGQVLTADSTAATGLKWAAASTTPTFVGCLIYGTSNPSIANNTLTTISFGAELFDSDNFHSNTTNNSRITIPSGKAGKYLITGANIFLTNSTGIRSIRFYKNGSLIYFYNMEAATSANTIMNVSYLADLAVNDYVEMIAYQTSGGALTMTNDDSSGTFLAVTYQGA